MPPESTGTWPDREELRASERAALRRAAAWFLALAVLPVANAVLLLWRVNRLGHDAAVLAIAGLALGEIAVLWAVFGSRGGRPARTGRTLAAAAAAAALTVAVGYVIVLYLLSQAPNGWE